ncbi:MAG: DUF4139 domain-containing protein [Pseudomonadota bacterium]
MLRFLTSTALVLAAPSFAADFNAESQISEITVFPRGALITRELSLDIPAGQHRILFAEPSDSLNGMPNIALPDIDGLRLISVQANGDGGIVLDVSGATYEERRTAYQMALSDLATFEQDDIALRSEIAAAQTLLRAAESLSGPDGQLVGSQGSLNPDATIDLMVKLSGQASEATARLGRAETQLAARDIEREELQRAVEVAKQALDQATPQSRNYTGFVLTVEATAPVSGAIQIENYALQASWSPRYRLDLDYEAMEGALSLMRQAFIEQATGLNWEDAQVTLSTASPSQRTNAPLPREMLLGLIENGYNAPKISRDFASQELSTMAEPAIAMLTEGEAASIALPQPVGAGQPVEYSLPNPVNLPSSFNGGAVVEIDRIEAPVTLFAEAVATRDTTAMLATDYTYDRGGLLLAGPTQIFHNGAFIGQGRLPEIASGDEAKIGLGPLKSVLVTHRVISREDGDRGLITSTNAREVRTETEIVNLTGFDVPLRLYDVLPVSEEEDLNVTEVSNPRPDLRDVEGRRGVLQWNVDLTPGATEIVQFGYDLAWPKDFEILPK